MIETLSKTLDPADYADPTLERLITQTVAPAMPRGARQHEHRQWEYGMALYAALFLREYRPWLDVGGAGSPLEHMRPVTVVDPHVGTGTIETYQGPTAAIITAISVLEHVKDEAGFLEACVRHLQPHGILFLTVDFARDGREDRYHFRWMRRRIYDQASLPHVAEQLRQHGCTVFGGDPDYTWHGPQVYNYTFASLCVQKGA